MRGVGHGEESERSGAPSTQARHPRLRQGGCPNALARGGRNPPSPGGSPARGPAPAGGRPEGKAWPGARRAEAGPSCGRSGRRVVTGPRGRGAGVLQAALCGARSGSQRRGPEGVCSLAPSLCDSPRGSGARRGHSPSASLSGTPFRSEPG